MVGVAFICCTFVAKIKCHLSIRCYLYLPQPKLEYFKRSFIYVGPYVWNDIPDSIRNMNSKHSFKKE